MSEFEAVLERTGGDLRKVEEALSLDPGTLAIDDTIIAYIAPEDLHGLRMPDGNELGANAHWIPGGHTAGGVPEATVDALHVAPKAFPSRPLSDPLLLGEHARTGPHEVLLGARGVGRSRGGELSPFAQGASVPYFASVRCRGASS